MRQFREFRPFSAMAETRWPYMAHAPVSARNCEVTITLDGARVGRSWTPISKDDMTHIVPLSTFQRVNDGSCADFKRHGL